MDTLSRLSHDADSEVAMVNIKHAGHFYLQILNLAIIVSVEVDFFFVNIHTVCMCQAAIISLGLIGAGTNNARIAGMLRNLSSYYYKDASLLFCVWAHSDCLIMMLFYTHPNTRMCIKLRLANYAGAYSSRSCPSWQRVVDSISLSF